MSYEKYLDASAAIKLVVDECRSAELRQFFGPRTNFVITPFCFYEALSTLKAKWKGRKDSAGMTIRITDQQYHDGCYLLIRYAGQNKIEVTDDLNLSDITVQPEVERLAIKHGLDISDALQLLTILKGRSRYFVDESKTLLISDDKQLIEAAEKEGIRFWYLSDPLTKPGEASQPVPPSP